MPSNTSGYLAYTPRNCPYNSNSHQDPSTYYMPNTYLPPSSPSYGSVPMSISNSGSSQGSLSSDYSSNSRHSPYANLTTDDEFPSSQKISASASNSHIDFSYTAPVSTYTNSKGKDKQRTSPESATNPKTGLLCCLHGGCNYQTKRQYDLDRHLKTHFPAHATEKFDCSGRGCGRTGEYGFDRKDHLREHLRKVHAKNIPKQSRRRSSERSNHRRS